VIKAYLLYIAVRDTLKNWNVPLCIHLRSCTLWHAVRQKYKLVFGMQYKQSLRNYLTIPNCQSAHVEKKTIIGLWCEMLTAADIKLAIFLYNLKQSYLCTSCVCACVCQGLTVCIVFYQYTYRIISMPTTKSS